MVLMLLVIAVAYYIIKYKYRIYSMLISVIFKVICSFIVLSMIAKFIYSI